MEDINPNRELIETRDVWLVDGDEKNRRRLQHCLFQLGYKVRAFKDIASATANGNRSYRFLLVTAEQLPDGYFGDLIRDLTPKHRVLSAIVTSVDSSIEHVVDAFRHGANDYLVDPYSSIELNDVIQHALRRAAKKEEIAA